MAPPDDAIDARDNFQRMMRGDAPTRLPFDITTTEPVRREIRRRLGVDSAVEAFGSDFGMVASPCTSPPERWREALANLGFQWPDLVEISGTGCAWTRPPVEELGEADHLREQLHPISVVETVEQLKALPWPDLDDPSFGDGLEARVQAIRDRGLVVVGAMETTVFEQTWYARGMEQLMFDLVDDNGVGEWLLDWHTRRSCLTARKLVEAGVDVVGLGDDVGTQHGMMMAPEFWRQHLKPRLARVIQAVRDAQGDRPVWVRYHSDGAIDPILDDLADIGVDILNPVQPECMPTERILPRYRDRFAFWGMVGTQTTMPFGTPDDVRAVVAQLAEFARQGVRVIAAPTHVLEPDVPWANIEALTDAVHTTRLGAGTPEPTR